MNFFKSLDVVAKQLPTILVGPTCAPVDVMDFRVYLHVLTVMAASVTTVKRLPKKMTVVQMSNLVIRFTWMKKTCYLAQKRLFQSRLFATAAIVISWMIYTMDTVDDDFLPWIYEETVVTDSSV